MYRIIFPLIAFCVFFFSTAASAGVVMYDDVSPVDKTVTLRALTKGRFFPEGGKLVTFRVGDRSIGSRLSGGDGYAFIQYKPSSPGIKKIGAESGGAADEGVLLVTGEKGRVILVHIEGALLESLFSLTPAQKGQASLRKLSDKHGIIYLTTLMGVKQSGKWLRENDFPLSPVFQWEGTAMIDELIERGIEIYAIVGSDEMILDAPGVKKRFSFDETEEGTEVSDWDEMVKLLE